MSSPAAISETTVKNMVSATYEVGSTPVVACRNDPRFSYCLYVPPTLHHGAAPELVVAMHGTGRSFMTYRDQLSSFGRWHNCIVLAPLFPIGVMGDGNRDGFKYMVEADIRYDQVLAWMVEDIEHRYEVRFPQFALFGYSGGGHFAHRFLLIHPNRLWAVSIGAPGSVTLLDPSHDWWVGTKDFAERFGAEVNLDAVRKVAVQMIVGAADLETWEITHREGGRNWMPDANHAGRTRPERLERLRQNFEEHGISVQFDLVPNMAHEGTLAVPIFENFLAESLAVHRTRSQSQIALKRA